MTGYENITHMCFPLVTPVLPSVFDESLSYYECLTHVVGVLNKTIDAVNFIGNNTEQLFNQWINEHKDEVLLKASYNEESKTLFVYANE
jgi:hypothetical protein